MPETTMSCMMASCMYTYGTWSDCTNRKQTRTKMITNMPCIMDSPGEEITKDCTPNCEYTTGNWSECAMNGKKTRSVISNNQPCTVMGPAPESEVACMVKLCEYTLDQWTVCALDGTRTRKVTVNNQPCQPPAMVPEGMGTCTPLECEYTVGEWSVCARDSTRNRTVTAKNMPCKPPASVPATTGACVPPPLNCNYTYDTWGPCQMDNKMYRAIKTNPDMACPKLSAETVQVCTFAAPNDPTCPAMAPADTIWGVWSLCSANKQSRLGKLPMWYPNFEKCQAYKQEGPCISPLDQVNSEHLGSKEGTGVAVGKMLDTVEATARATMWIETINGNVPVGDMTTVDGMYGRLSIKKDGSWTFNVRTDDPSVSIFGNIPDVLSDPFSVKVKYRDANMVVTERSVTILVRIWNFV